jgi:gliding motility-associated-like protein
MRTKGILLLLALLWLHVTQHAEAQCTSTISTFPYSENFEGGNGNFTAGGSNSDWAYGMPNKQIIGNAASGTKCWIVGGLSNGSYNNAENSWLQSPCFDFSSLTNPQISFSVFWETEKKYDGASMKYSIDGGNNWLTLGSASSNSNCNGSNWFNTTTINSLGVDGWSGNIQPTSPCPGGAGNGSGTWVTAKHTLASLAGKPSVIFRFVFAAGTQCNAYDGFAIDDFTISETPANSVDFIFSCSGNNTVNFTNTSSICGSNFIWNFDDVTSPNNTSTLENPTHVFATTGTHNVSLTVTFPGNLVVIKSKPVTVINVSTVVTSPIRCNGDATAAIATAVSGSNGPFTYSWNTNPVQNTATANNLIAGSYTVTLGGNNVCNTSSTRTVNQPTALNATITTTNALCGNNNGTITTTVTGGNAPYTYNWSNGGTTANQNNLSAGSYSLLLNDANSCSKQYANIVVKDSVKKLSLYLGNDTAFCPGNQLVLNAGSFASYLWQDNSAQPTFTVTQTGKYYVMVTDADGCTVSDTINIVVDCSDIYFPSAFTPNGDDKNKLFGPFGNIASITSFTMSVYGRWGELLFSSTNPYNKWDGKFKGTDADDGTYVWFAVYSINNKPKQTQKGTITILR